MSLADLFQPVVIVPRPTRVINLCADDPPEPRKRRLRMGPPKPRKQYKRTPEQNREKARRYVERHGREIINARERARYARAKHESC